MFGYVLPYIPELKVKDYEKFKAYYCGLCRCIKKNIGNIPRVSLNYDMTFLAILLDSLSKDKLIYKRNFCMVHPIKKKTMLEVDSFSPLNYAAYCNVILANYKILDDIKDDNSVKHKFMSLCLRPYLKKFPENFKSHTIYINNSLHNLWKMENDDRAKSFDGICHAFSDLTGYILSSYTEESKNELYWLGYNLGKWIYIIDSLDDLEEDMRNNKFNLLSFCFNEKKLCYHEFYSQIKDRVDFILGTCASQCMNFFKKLPILKNEELLYNILQYGLLNKMDKVFKKGDYKNEKSI